jgi:hypothetical protein
MHYNKVCQCSLPEDYYETIEFVAQILEGMKHRLDNLLAQLDS